MKPIAMTKNFRISIPKEVCESQGWKPGQKLTFVARGGGYELVPVLKPDDLVNTAEGPPTAELRDR
jgi:AbrB family looped-hinge helix DNA binding protein